MTEVPTRAVRAQTDPAPTIRDQGIPIPVDPKTIPTTTTEAFPGLNRLLGMS